MLHKTRLVFLLLLVFLWPSLAFAHCQANNPVSSSLRGKTTFSKANSLCSAHNKTLSHPTDLRLEYESIRKQSPKQALILNLLPLTGFGVGSFLQGDTVGGMLALVSSVGGLVSLFQGSVMSSSGLLVFGLVGVVASVVIGVVRPFWYDYQQRLKFIREYRTHPFKSTPTPKKAGQPSLSSSTRLHSTSL